MYTVHVISSFGLCRMYCESAVKPCSHRTSHHLSLCQLFCRTNLYYCSFLPYTLSLWNKLDSSIVSSSSLKLLREVLGYCMLKNLFHYFGVYFYSTYLLLISFCNCCKLVFQVLFSCFWSFASVLAYVCYVHIFMI